MAAAALPADGSSQGLEAGLVPEVAAALASSLQLALQAVPSLAGPAALAPVEALLPVLPQVIACCLEGLACDLPAMHVCNECGCWPPVQECLDVRCSGSPSGARAAVHADETSNVPLLFCPASRVTP